MLYALLEVTCDFRAPRFTYSDIPLLHCPVYPGLVLDIFLTFSGHSLDIFWTFSGV